MEKTYVIETTYSVKYTNRKPVPIADIIESLESLEKILRRTPAFIEKYYKGIKIVETEIYVSSIESGSLIEEFLIKYVCKGQKNYDDAKEVIAKIIGDNEVIKTIVTLGVGAAITYGVMMATSGDQKAPAIEAYNNTIINIGADIDFKAQDIKAVLEAMPSKKTLAKDSVKAISPAKLEPNATIEMGNHSRFTMSKKYIAEAPAQYEPPIPDEKESKYTNIEIFIYASDRDNYTKGWGGIAPELFDHRVKFELSDEVNPAKLHGRTKARADVIVHEKFVREKKAYIVKYVEIIRIN